MDAALEIMSEVSTGASADHSDGKPSNKPVSTSTPTNCVAADYSTYSSYNLQHGHGDQQQQLKSPTTTAGPDTSDDS